MLRHKRCFLCRSSRGLQIHTRGGRISWNRLKILSTRSLLIHGHDGQLIDEEYLEGNGDAEDHVHDENNSPVTPEVLRSRWSRYSSEIQAVFAHLILILRQHGKITTEVL